MEKKKKKHKKLSIVYETIGNISMVVQNKTIDSSHHYLVITVVWLGEHKSVYYQMFTKKQMIIWLSNVHFVKNFN